MHNIEMEKFYRCPQGPVDLVLDTDTYNEIDDQYAIAYLLKSGEKLKVKGFTVAPFFNERMIKSIGEGLIKSREEIIKVLRLSGKEEYIDKIHMGSDRFLKDENTPVESDAAKFLIEYSKNYSKDNPLYVVAIGAITNVASALLVEPGIVDRICIVWLSGAALGWWVNREYNMYQDYAAARVVMKSRAPFIHIPAHGVVSELLTTRYELEHWLKGKNALCDYLVENTVKIAEQNTNFSAWSRVIWDVAAPAWLLNENDKFMYGCIRNRQLPAYEGDCYEKEPLDLKMFCVNQINRDAIMTDLFEKLIR